jgi:hypothetical protein
MRERDRCYDKALSLDGHYVSLLYFNESEEERERERQILKRNIYIYIYIYIHVYNIKMYIRMYV